MTNGADGTTCDRASMACRVFLEAMKKGSVHELVRAAGEFWGYGIVLTDENYYLISQYPNRLLGEDVWDTLYQHKVLPNDVIQSFQNMYLSNINKTYKPFYADWGLIGDFPRIFAEIYTEDRILGHVGVFLLGNELQKDDLDIAQLFVDALQIMMSRASAVMPPLSNYLSDLLRPDTNSNLKEWAAEFIGRFVAKNYVVMVTPIGDSAAQKAFAEYSAGQMPRIYRNAVSTIFEGNIVSLFGNMGETVNQQTEYAILDQAAGFLNNQHMTSGLSETFADLVQTHRQYLQASLTSSLSKKRLSYYREHAPAQMFLYVTRSTDAEAFIHPVLFQMDEYDKRNRTNYFATMRTYCFSMHNVDVASKKLFIHRNTLAYRLKRITELFGVAIEEELTARYLISSFELWDCLSVDVKQTLQTN